MRRVSSLTAVELVELEAGLRTAKTAQANRIHRIIAGSMMPHLEDWGREFFPHYVQDATSLMHRDMITTLLKFSQTKGRGLKEACIAPRGGAKTTWTSKLYTLYCICHGLEHYILLIGETAGQSQANLKSIQHELTGNRELATAYPHICGAGPVWNVDEIITRNDIKIEAAGAGKSIRGKSHGPHRPGLVLVDDLDDRDAVRSEDQRKRMWEWFTDTLMPIGDKSTHYFVVGTALNSDDTIHRLKKTGEFGWRRYRSLITEPTNDELWAEWRRLFLDFNTAKDERLSRALAFYQQHRAEMDAGASLLWPEHEPLYDLMCYRTGYGESAFQSEKQGFPTSDQSHEWPADLFEDTTTHRLSFHAWPDTKLRVIALDPSKGKTDSSDFSAFVSLGLGVDNLLYVDANLKRRDVTRIVEDGLRLIDEFQPHLFVVETNQFQELLATEFTRQAAERGTLLPLVGFNNTLKKQTRIRRLGPHLQQHQFRFRADSPGTVELLDQLRQFPHAKHDDGPDALDMALEGLKHLLHGDEPEPMTEEIRT